MSFVAKAALAVCAVGVAFHGATKNGGGRRARAHGDEASSLVAVTVSGDDIARGWRLESVETNGAAFCEMPANAVVYEPWTLRGGRETWFPLDLGDFAFPLGTDAVHRLRVKSGGEISTFRPNAPNAICAAAEWASLIPGVSCFWSADADGGAAKVLTWERVFANRDRTGEYSAQITLRRNGDFTTQSNDVRRVYRRVNPCDWDGDGLANDLDPNPTAYDGDFFGAANELPDGANGSAYCTVDLVVYGADALVEFAGDGASNYPDPRFVARADATNEVAILIGKTYDVSCAQPFDVVGVSDAATVVAETDGGYRIVRPVTIEAVDLSAQPQAQTQSVQRRALLATAAATSSASTSSASGGGGFTMSVDPANLGGVFTWNDSCCGVEFDGGVFSFVENSACTCLGCRASGAYVYEGYSIPVYGGWCCLHGDAPEWRTTVGPVAAGAAADFSAGAVIYEDAYENMPGVWVPKRSSRVRLNVSAKGGANGGTLSVSAANLGKLRKLAGSGLPLGSVAVPVNEEVAYSTIYEGETHSDATNDIEVVCAFAENGADAATTNKTSLTSVKIELTPRYEAPENKAPHRHVFGVLEQMNYGAIPQESPLTWRFAGGKEDIYPIRDGVVIMPATTNQFSNGVCETRVSATGASFTNNFRFYMPEIVAKNPRYDDGIGMHLGEAGWLLLHIDLYVKPFFVSFENVEFVEIPDESGNCPHGGYFDDVSKGGPLSHCAAAGAGEFIYVGKGGKWCSDKCGRNGAYEKPWLDGWKEWPIPIGWGASEKVLGQFDTPPTTQKFTLRSDGTFSIKKYGYEATRTKWNGRTIREVK